MNETDHDHPLRQGEGGWCEPGTCTKCEARFAELQKSRATQAPKVAFLVSGQLRGYRLAMPTWKPMIEAFKPDIYLGAPDDEQMIADAGRLVPAGRHRPARERPAVS